MDLLSKARFDWIKANASQLKPSGSMILRRALALYVIHVEQTLEDPELFEQEMVCLKASASPDECPWKHIPDFSKVLGKPLTQMIRETQRNRIDNFLNSSPFEGRAMRAVRKEPLLHGKRKQSTEAQQQ